ncbi:MAG: hypothetical protein WDN31_02115 [Hyphomicrobium sp.]
MRTTISRIAGAAIGIWLALCPAQTRAQSALSPFTTEYRYDVAGRLVGAIAPDPDDTGPLLYPATRDTYDAAGRLIRVEKGQLAAWQSEAIAPSAWTGFTVYQTAETDYDGLDRKIQERILASGVPAQVTQYSYDAGRQARMHRGADEPRDVFVAAQFCLRPRHTGSFGPDRITRTPMISPDDCSRCRRRMASPPPTVFDDAPGRLRNLYLQPQRQGNERHRCQRQQGVDDL